MLNSTKYERFSRTVWFLLQYRGYHNQFDLNDCLRPFNSIYKTTVTHNFIHTAVPTHQLLITSLFADQMDYCCISMKHSTKNGTASEDKTLKNPSVKSMLLKVTSYFKTTLYKHQFAETREYATEKIMLIPYKQFG